MEKINQIRPETLTAEERAVMANMMTGMREFKKITQDDIVKSARWQALRPYDINKAETEKRQIRKVIRDLRIKFGAPILSDRNGYWVCRDQTDAAEYIRALEIEAKSTAKAWFETYKAMKDTLNATSSFFENFNI